MRVCVPFWPVGAGGGPCWHGDKGVCVCLFGLLIQLVGLFGTGQGCECIPFWPGDAVGGPFWHGGKDACVCLFGLLMQLVGLFGMESRTRVYTFLAC